MCPANPVPSAESGLPSGLPSPGQEPAGCLILRVPFLSEQMFVSLKESVMPLAQSLNLEVMVLDASVEVEVRYSQDPILVALRDQIIAINRLAQSNEMLVQAMAEGDGIDDGRPATQYLDGSPVR